MGKNIWKKDISRRQFFGLTAGIAASGFMFSNIFHPEHVMASRELYKRVVILTDVHSPSSREKEKYAAIADINRWDDVDHVVVTGDLVFHNGENTELKAAVDLISTNTHPYYVLTGNHDYLYSDVMENATMYQTGPEERSFKLERFRKAFNMNALYFSKDVGGYHLVYLSPDSLDTVYLTEMSPEQLAWLDVDLANNQDKPTIIFFHGSLEGTWAKNGKNCPEDPKFMAQPAAEVRDILSRNPQVMVWVSGHLHLGVYNESSRDAKIYTYDINGVQNIHNPALLGTGFKSAYSDDGGSYPAMWTKSMYLYGDKVLFRCYDHTNHCFLPELDQAILVKRR